jgi:hypothetical protein
VGKVRLAALRNDRTAVFWQAVEKDIGDAPEGMRRLLRAQDSVWITDDEAREVYEWCKGRAGWVPFRKGGLGILGEEWPVRTTDQVSSGGRARATRQPG